MTIGEKDQAHEIALGLPNGSTLISQECAQGLQASSIQLHPILSLISVNVEQEGCAPVLCARELPASRSTHGRSLAIMCVGKRKLPMTALHGFLQHGLCNIR